MENLRTKINKLSKKIEANNQQLLKQMEEYNKAGKPLEFDRAYAEYNALFLVLVDLQEALKDSDSN